MDDSASPLRSLTASPWSRVFLMVCGFLVLFLGVLLYGLRSTGRGERDEWAAFAHRALAEDPGPNALALILEAMDRVNWRELNDNRPQLRQAALQGWQEDSPPLREVLRGHSPALAMLSLSTATPAEAFPPLEGMGTEAHRPDLSRMEALVFLMAANARLAEAEGQPAEALQRLVELAVFGTRFQRPRQEATLTHHLVGLSALEVASNGILDVLGGWSDAEPLWLERLAMQLEAVEQRMVPVREGIAGELRLYRESLVPKAGNPEGIAVALRYFDETLSPSEALSEARELISDSLTLQGELNRVMAALEGELARPAWERQRLDRAWLGQQTENKLLNRHLPEPEPLAIREAVMLARLRLARAVCLARLGRDAEAAELLDPFSGEPFKWREGIVYSIGPGREDGGGERSYSPSAGLHSHGDIVAGL